MDVKHAFVDNANIHGIHGYCTVYFTNAIYLYDVCCQIEGDDAFIGRNLSDAEACALVNKANLASFYGEEVCVEPRKSWSAVSLHHTKGGLPTVNSDGSDTSGQEWIDAQKALSAAIAYMQTEFGVDQGHHIGAHYFTGQFGDAIRAIFVDYMRDAQRTHNTDTKEVSK